MIDDECDMTEIHNALSFEFEDLEIIDEKQPIPMNVSFNDSKDAEVSGQCEMMEIEERSSFDNCEMIDLKSRKILDHLVSVEYTNTNHTLRDEVSDQAQTISHLLEILSYITAQQRSVCYV